LQVLLRRNSVSAGALRAQTYATNLGPL